MSSVKQDYIKDIARKQYFKRKHESYQDLEAHFMKSLKSLPYISKQNIAEAES